MAMINQQKRQQVSTCIGIKIEFVLVPNEFFYSIDETHHYESVLNMPVCSKEDDNGSESNVNITNDNNKETVTTAVSKDDVHCTNTYCVQDVAAVVSLQELAKAILTNAREVPDEMNIIDDFPAIELHYKKMKQIYEEKKKRIEEEKIDNEKARDMNQQQEWENKRHIDGNPNKPSSNSSILLEDEQVDAHEIGEIAPFSFLISREPFDFQKYVPIANENPRGREKNTVWVSNNHVPVGKGIGDKYVRNWLHFNGKNDEDDNFKVCIYTITLFVFSSSYVFYINICCYYQIT